jgi:hypothetical protein
MQPSPAEVKAQIFVAVAAALINKWPARNEADHKDIASATAKLTRVLYEKYAETPSKEE